MKIKDLTLSERPRERLAAAGAGTLSTGELIAILLRSGTSSMNVIDLSRTILRAGGDSLLGLSRLSMEDLCAIPGVKQSKAAVILAAIELCRRFADEKGAPAARQVLESKTVYEIMAPCLKGLAHEECWALMLDSRQRLICRRKITSGSSDEVTLDCPAIIRDAMKLGARALILVHNHPSGNPLPSDADLRRTRALQKMAATCEIAMLDHVIFSDGAFYSFADDKKYEL